MKLDLGVDRLLELHKIASQELRHTSTVIWQFSIAIMTLQGAALTLSGGEGADPIQAKIVLAGGFLFSCLFSIMLLRQATERRGYVIRMKAVESKLRMQIQRRFFLNLPTTCSWFKSHVLAWLLLIESTVGFLASIVLLAFHS